MGDSGNPLVDSDSDIYGDNYDNYTHQSDGDWWGPYVTEGYGKDRDRYDDPTADGDADGNKPKIEGSGWAHGIPIADDGMALLSGVRESAHELWHFIQTGELSDVSGLLDTWAAEIGVVGDAVSIVDDPVGTLVDWAVSWVLEHVTVLRMALDGLAGNPDVINAYSNTWDNIGGRLEEVGRDFDKTALTAIGDWSGSARNAYQTMAADLSTAIDAAEKLAHGLALLLVAVAQLVNGVRDLVKALISELVAMVIDAAEALLGDEEGAGGGVVRAAADVGSKAVHVLAKLAKTLEVLGPVITAAKAILAAIDSAWHKYQSG